MEADIPSILQLEEMIAKIDNIRDKAIISFLYLTGARVSEIVFKFKVKDLTIEKDANRQFFVFYIYTEKRREKTDIYRKVGIPYDKFKYLIDIIREYIKRTGLVESSYLSDVNRRTAHRICTKWMRFHPHYLRHIRLTHLASINGFNALELQQFAGWTNTNPASVYVHLNWKDISHKL
jgi:integrase